MVDQLGAIARRAHDPKPLEYATRHGSEALEREQLRKCVKAGSCWVAPRPSHQRVVFRKVGVMRQYERGPDGTWHDGLLIEMLRGDLRESDVTGIVSPPSKMRGCMTVRSTRYSNGHE